MEGDGEVGGNIKMCPPPAYEGAPKLTRSFGSSRQGNFRNAYLTQIQTYFKVCIHVATPETQNNTPNPRKSVVFIICPLDVRCLIDLDK